MLVKKIFKYEQTWSELIEIHTLPPILNFWIRSSGHLFPQ